MARSNEKLKAIVPLTATAVDAIKGIYNVLNYYKEPVPRTQLDLLFRDHARTNTRALADSRLDWYTKYSLMHYSRPRSMSNAKNPYLVGIDKEKVIELYELCESIDWYGFYPAQKVAISFKSYYRDKKINSKNWVSIKELAGWLDTTTASIYGLTDEDKDIFSDAVLKELSPVEVRVDGSNPPLALYRPNGLAREYLDTWKKIHNWIDTNEVTRHIDVPTAKGWSKRLAIWK